MPETTEARDRRIRATLDLVTPIALHYARTTRQDRDDLIQVGRLGLIKAAGLYKASAGVPFRAFARPHIRGAILHYLRDSVGLVRLPRRVQERAQQLLRQQSRAAQSRLTGESWADQQILEDYRHRSAWQPLAENEHRLTPSVDNPTTRGLDEEERSAALCRYWHGLPELERHCLRAVVLEGISLRATARSLGTSAMTVQRRVKKAFSTLSRQCRAEGIATW